MIKETDKYFANKQEPTKSCLLALRDMVLNQDIDIAETMKYGMPCYCYKKKMFCFLWTNKKNNEPYILFVEGKHLNHPKLEVGNRSRMKVFRVDPNQDLPKATIELLLQKALQLYLDGTILIK